MSKMPGRWTHVHTQQLDSEMPLQRYLLWVGGALLALLFAANSLLPPPVSNDLINSRARLPMVRIHSELKGPQAVVIDTNTAAVVPNLVAQKDTVPAPTAIPSEWTLKQALAHLNEPWPSQAGFAEKKGEGRQQTHRKVVVRLKQRRLSIHRPEPVQLEPDPALFRERFAQSVQRGTNARRPLNEFEHW